jgi:hypothetical protein
MKKRKSSKKNKIVEKEIEDVEKWIIARRKFFIRLFWAIIFVIFLLILGNWIDKIR